ncbi:MAG: hypothetical protein ACREN8_01400 [Candidatus Dormibacteraceae bacterium]
MRLEAADVVHLPLAGALLDNHGQLIATTPEWEGPSPGTLSFHTGYAQLLVAVGAAPPKLDILSSQLLEELSLAAMQPGIEGRRVRLLLAGLRLVAGRPVEPDDTGSAERVFQLAHAGITARSPNLQIIAKTPPTVSVPAPAAIALALVQFAVNASRHDHAERIFLQLGEGPTFYVEWESPRSGGVEVETHRHQELRARWGWGYIQRVADALGATALPPGPTASGRQGACISLGSIRLTLPLASLEQTHIVRSTEAWDQDVGITQGQSINEELTALAAAAQDQPGEIITAGLFQARCYGERSWLAMAPQDGINRARDLLRGLNHEHALLHALEPHVTRIYALATLLGVALGDDWPAVSPSTWEEGFPLACQALGIAIPEAPPSLILPDPRITAFLLAQLGGQLIEVGDELRLQPASGGENHPLLTILERDEAGYIHLTKST